MSADAGRRRQVLLLTRLAPNSSPRHRDFEDAPHGQFGNCLAARAAQGFYRGWAFAADSENSVSVARILT
jgi:hypothetical protein